MALRGAAITLLLRAAQRAGVPDGIAIASPQRFGAATRAAAARSIAHSGAFDLKTYDAELTAHSRLTAAQSATAIASALASLALWALNPDWLGLACWVGLFIVFASSIGLRLAAVAARSRSASIEPIADANLPIYSIVAPLYREANMVDQLVAAFDAIDYPRAKLDVKIVVEEDDIETLRAIARRRLPARYDIVVAPGELLAPSRAR